jgi:hypothetical protein
MGPARETLAYMARTLPRAESSLITSLAPSQELLVIQRALTCHTTSVRAIKGRKRYIARQLWVEEVK